jgi:redox-sensitive bicupin YhaK (pirin superfamily)
MTMDMCLLALFILSMSVAADLRGGFGDFSSSPHPKSQEHILTYVFQGYLTHDMAFNRMISICDESKTKYKLISLC